ncbi:MAG: MBL fold metallo-hydrolase [Candidatus Hydrogenedentes bacterium]|nr:MBL fold metallo-hydrolase [Candidatus Hydrogenedentota bacterium]
MRGSIRTRVLGAVAGLAVLVAALPAFAAKPIDQKTDLNELTMLPGLYKLAGNRGTVSDVYVVLTPKPVLIDCGSRNDWDTININLKRFGLKLGDVKWVIATHGHWDHVDNMARIQREFPKVKFAIHAGDAQFVINNDRVFSCAEPLYKGVPSDPIKVDRVLLDGDTIKVGRNTFRFVHTPGHTPGSITIETEIAGKKVGFCGDSVTGYYSLTNRSCAIDWENSMKRLLKEDLDQLYIGHREKPFSGKDEIHAYLQKSLDAASYKRQQLIRDEEYQNLVHSFETKP